MPDPTSPGSRGTKFEDSVASMLESLQFWHPHLVKVRRHPRIELHNGTFAVPDFELICTFPHQVDHRIIECQDRSRSSQEVVHKIRTIKALSPRNRFILVYMDRDYLSAAVRQALDGDGIGHYHFIEFCAFVMKLGRALHSGSDPEADPSFFGDLGERRLVLEGVASPPFWESRMDTKEDEVKKRLANELGQGILNDVAESIKSFRQKGDQAMLSSPPKRGW